MKMRTSATGKKGFTLVEIMVVLVIISVLAGMIVPHMSGRTTAAKLRASARRLLVAARYARDFAATRRRKCRLVIDTKEQQYVLTCQQDPEHEPDLFAPLKTALGRAERLADGLTFSRVRIEPRHQPDTQQSKFPDCITFEPTGQADAAVLEITDGRNTYSVLIAPQTGSAKLIEGVVDELPNDRIDLDS